MWGLWCSINIGMKITEITTPKPSLEMIREDLEANDTPKQAMGGLMSLAYQQINGNWTKPMSAEEMDAFDAQILGRGKV